MASDLEHPPLQAPLASQLSGKWRAVVRASWLDVELRGLALLFACRGMEFGSQGFDKGCGPRPKLKLGSFPRQNSLLAPEDTENRKHKLQKELGWRKPYNKHKAHRRPAA